MTDRHTDFAKVKWRKAIPVKMDISREDGHRHRVMAMCHRDLDAYIVPFVLEKRKKRMRKIC